MASTPNDWDQLEALIDRVLDAAPEARAPLIAELSGTDAARRAEIERLVAECERGYPLLDRPVAERFAGLLESETMHVPAVIAERYRIVRELGRGGMAVVYLAHDVKHDRDVAVKIVRPELAATLGRARFLREIAIAAKLKHPHIVPLFDSGEVDGLLYYVMPYQEEQSLRERLKRDGALPVDDAIAILSDVCDALAYAHLQGVVHRDIKPDNILLSGRHALVTDFGVARAVSAASEQDTLTTAGGVVGTAAYMAPEQHSAQSLVDHRVDLYAVGVMAYEMLAGERPFSGDTPPSQRGPHATKAAVDLTKLRSEAPYALVALVSKCLATQPVDRYQRAEEVLSGLESLGSVSGRRTPARVASRSRLAKVAIMAGVAGVAGLVWTIWPAGRAIVPPRTAPRLAVLIFQHDGDDLEPLAMGLSDNLIGALGDVPGLDVRSLNAVLPYRDSLTPPDVLGRRLDVAWLVGGRLYRDGAHIVASVQLMEAETGRLIARREATAAAGENVRLIEQLVPKVATMLRERLGDEIRLRSWRAGTRSDAAFAALNRAHRERSEANRLAALRDVQGAMRHLHSADSSLAVASRADLQWVEPLVQRAVVARNAATILEGSGHSSDSIGAVLQQGIRHAEQAIRLAPTVYRAKEVLAILLYAAADAASADSALARRAMAEKLLREVAETDTTLVDGLTLLSDIHFRRGEYEQAYILAEKAYRADAYYKEPQVVLNRLFTFSFEAEEDVAAQRWCTTYQDLVPDDWFGGYCRLALMTWDATETPNADTARAIADRATASVPRVIRPAVSVQLQTLLAGVLARLGRSGSAQQELASVRSAIAADPKLAREPFGSELLEIESAVRLRLGQRDTAISLLRELLKRAPERGTRLARSRRFRGLPFDDLPNGNSRNR